MRHILEMEILRSRGHVTCLQSRCCHRGEAGLGPAGPSSQAPSLAYCEEETESKRRECQSPERSRRLLDPELLITWQSVSSHAKGRVWTTLAATFSKAINSFHDQVPGVSHDLKGVGGVNRKEEKERKEESKEGGKK